MFTNRVSKKFSMDSVSGKIFIVSDFVSTSTIIDST